MVIHDDSRNALLNYKNKIDLIITSPPYADARKKHYDSIDPNIYSTWFMSFHDAFWNSLKDSGSLVINIKDKRVDGVRHRYVWDTINNLSKLGWYCLDDYVWHKTNPFPGAWHSKLRDGWEYCFHLAKSKRPYFNIENIKEVTLNNLRHGGVDKSVQSWTGYNLNSGKLHKRPYRIPPNVIISPAGCVKTGHPASFPVKLPEFFIKLLTPENGLVCDPFAGSGTTGLAALNLNRKYLLIDNKKEYCDLMQQRINKHVSKAA